EDLQQPLVGELHQIAGGQRRGGGRAFARVVQRHLTEDLARPQDGQEVLAPVRCHVAQFHLAGSNDEQAITLRALVEDLLPPTEGQFGGALSNRTVTVVAEFGEQRSGSNRGLVHRQGPFICL